MAGPVPPTTEGEMAELNSQSMITLNACPQLNRLSVITMIRYIYDRSRTAIIRMAMKRNKTTCQVNSTNEKLSTSKFLYSKKALAANPIRIGQMILLGRKLLMILSKVPENWTAKLQKH